MPGGSRPRLRPHTPLLRRGPGAVQVGSWPGFGVVVEGLTDAEVDLLERLDGSDATTGVYARALATGVPAERVAVLLDLLGQCRLLLEDPADRAMLRRLGPQWRELLAPDAGAVSAAFGTGDGYAVLHRRRRQRVLVCGTGAVPAAVAALLRAGGIGTVSTGGLAGDAADLDLRGPWDGPPPDLVVLVTSGVLDPGHAQPWLRRGVAQLPVVVAGPRVVVGPVVTGAGPCLACLDLHRADLDPAWPAVLAQLTRDALAEPPPATTSTALTSVGAGLAAGMAHARLDGQPVPYDVSVEVSMAWPQVGYRRWERHPRCRCGVEPAKLVPRATDPGDNEA